MNCEEQIYCLQPAVMLKILIIAFAFVLLSPTVPVMPVAAIKRLISTADHSNLDIIFITVKKLSSLQHLLKTKSANSQI